MVTTVYVTILKDFSPCSYALDEHLWVGITQAKLNTVCNGLDDVRCILQIQVIMAVTVTRTWSMDDSVGTIHNSPNASIQNYLSSMAMMSIKHDTFKWGQFCCKWHMTLTHIFNRAPSHDQSLENQMCHVSYNYNLISRIHSIHSRCKCCLVTIYTNQT